MKLPTLEQFLEQNLSKKNKYGTYDGVSKDEILLFTRLHVQDALKEAAEKATATIEVEYDDQPSSSFPPSEYAVVDKQSILNAYPATNIK